MKRSVPAKVFTVVPAAIAALLLSSCGGTKHPESASTPAGMRSRQPSSTQINSRGKQPKLRIYTNDVPITEKDIPPRKEQVRPHPRVPVELPPVEPRQPVVDSASVPDETVTINNVRYKVPAPWAGNRLQAPAFSTATFKQIPPIHVHNGNEIYVKKVAWKPLIAMILAASKDGVILQTETAWRSFEAQREIFERKFREGRTWDDVVRYVAPPGYSEHMLGTAVDFYPSGWKFASTPAYSWLKRHANHFGFYESYPKVKKPGHLPIAWESWHWRYLGKNGAVAAPGKAAGPASPPAAETDTGQQQEQQSPATTGETAAENQKGLSPEPAASEDATVIPGILVEPPPDPGELPPPPPGTEETL